MKRQANDITLQKVMPHDEDTEQAVLATLMRYNEKFSEYSDLLSPELFYGTLNKAIYKCIEGTINGGGITDINSLYNYAQSHEVADVELFRNDFLKIFQLASTNTFEQDVRRLRNMSKRRMCWMMMQHASQNILDLTTDFDDEVGAFLSSVNEITSDMSDDSVASFGDALGELSEIVNNNINGKKQFLATGIRLFDEYYLLQPNAMTVLAAFTGVGKSALALNIAMNVALGGDPVAYYSLEMGKAELASRGISKDMSLSSSVIMNRQLSEVQLRMFDEVLGKYKNLPIYFDDRSTVAFDRTIRSIRTMVKTKGIKLVIIDYLQIYSQMSDDAEASIAYMARSAKNIAKECHIPVVVLSQLNRSSAHPSIKMLRGSGQIEESADNIVLIDRPEAYPDNKVTSYEGEFKDESIKGTAKLILAKGRGVGTASSLMGFDKMHTRFFEIQKQEAERQYDNSGELPF